MCSSEGRRVGALVVSFISVQATESCAFWPPVGPRGAPSHHVIGSVEVGGADMWGDEAYL